MKSTRSRTTLLLPLAPTFFLTLAAPLPAVELSDLAGDWSVADMTTPTRLREVYYHTINTTTRTSYDSSDFAGTNEVLSNAFYPVPVSVDTRIFALSASGTATGEETGQVLSINNNRLSYSDGTDPTMLYANTTGDLLLESSRVSDEQEVSFCLKRPATMTTNELDGDWKIVSFILPDDLTTVTSGANLTDTYFDGEEDLLLANINVSSGVITGDIGGTIVATSSPGVATANIGGPFTVNVNESKNVMTATIDDGIEQEIIVVTKKPAALATADLAGTWRLTSLTVPSSLTEVYYNSLSDSNHNEDSEFTAGANDTLVDLFHSDPFELLRANLLVSASGAFTGLGAGTLTANGNKTVNLSLDGDNVTFNINADKTCMVTGREDSEIRELIILVKTADSVPSGAEGIANLSGFQASGGGLQLFWNGSSGLLLEESTTLGNGSWGEVPGTTGANSYSVTPGGGSKFFRVTQSP